MILNYQGQSYEITNWDEFSNQLLNKIGVQVESEVVKNVNDMRLVDTGFFKNSIGFEVKDDALIVYSTAPYAVFLEYGTLEYWQAYGMDSYIVKLDPKKKDMKASERKNYPRGGQPFAPFRRVLYNPEKMSQIITRGLKH